MGFKEHLVMSSIEVEGIMDNKESANLIKLAGFTKEDVGKAFLTAAAMTGAATGINALSDTLTTGIGNTYNSLMENSRFKKMLAKNPNVSGDKYDRRAFNVLNSFSPSIAKNPVASGALMPQLRAGFKGDAGIGTDVITTLSRMEDSLSKSSPYRADVRPSDLSMLAQSAQAEREGDPRLALEREKLDVHKSDMLLRHENQGLKDKIEKLRDRLKNNP